MVFSRLYGTDGAVFQGGGTTGRCQSMQFYRSLSLDIAVLVVPMDTLVQAELDTSVAVVVALYTHTVVQAVAAVHPWQTQA